MRFNRCLSTVLELRLVLMSKAIDLMRVVLSLSHQTECNCTEHGTEGTVH